MEDREGGFCLTDELVAWLVAGHELSHGKDAYLRVLAREVARDRGQRAVSVESGTLNRALEDAGASTGSYRARLTTPSRARLAEPRAR